MGTQRGGSVSASSKMCPKREEEEEKREREREVSESSHSVLCWYKRRQRFWSHLWVCNSQTEDSLSWFFNCSNSSLNNWHEERANISKPHIKKGSPQQLLMSLNKFLKEKKLYYFLSAAGPNIFEQQSSCSVATWTCRCNFQVSETSPYKWTNLWAALWLHELSRIAFNIWWGQHFLFVSRSIRHQNIRQHFTPTSSI